MTVAPFLLLAAVTAAWVILPLIPALRELFLPTDAEPLNAVGHDAGDLTIFADGFREYLSRQLPAAALLASPAEAAQPSDAQALVPAGERQRALVGTLGDGTPFVQLADDAAALDEVAHRDGVIPRVVIAARPLALPGGETFLLELLARETLRGGSGAVYRAVLGERDISLGERSEVLRWIHAAGDLRVGGGSALHGRASATGRLLLHPGVTFRRVRAARVVAVDATGGIDGAIEDPPIHPPLVSGTVKLPAGARREPGYTRIAGDLLVPSGGAIVGSLVVHGRLTVGDGARIGGSVKTHGDCTLGDDVVIDGSVVSRGSVVTGARCHVSGSIAAERDVVIGIGCWVGGPKAPASVVAESMVLSAGAQVFGAISARKGGRTR